MNGWLVDSWISSLVATRYFSELSVMSLDVSSRRCRLSTTFFLRCTHFLGTSCTPPTLFSTFHPFLQAFALCSHAPARCSAFSDHSITSPVPSQRRNRWFRNRSRLFSVWNRRFRRGGKAVSKFCKCLGRTPWTIGWSGEDP